MALFNFSGTTGNNVAIGYEALTVNQANNLTAVGTYALQLNTTGILNTALGFKSLQNNSTGNENIAIGVDSYKIQLVVLI